MMVYLYLCFATDYDKIVAIDEIYLSLEMTMITDDPE